MKRQRGGGRIVAGLVSLLASGLVHCAGNGSEETPDASLDAPISADGRPATDAFSADHARAPDAVADAHPDRTTPRGDAAGMDAGHDAAADAALPPEAGPGPDATGPMVDAGTCQSDAGCSGTETCCGTCVDTSTDPNNCGGCFQECDDSATCDVGACVFASCSQATENAQCLISAGVHGTCCGGSCQAIDTKTDPSNCGGCGLACPTGSTCSPSLEQSCTSADGGAPTCQPGAAAGCPPGDVCSPYGTNCLATTCSAATAGGPCGIAGETAAQGTCCGDSCVNASLDDGNCGTCGNVCPTGSFCNGGECAKSPSCATAASATPCPVSPGVVGSCCDGACIDLSKDPNNCGTCGRACASGASCSNYECTSADGGVASCGSVGSCPAGDLCFQQEFCLTETCAAGDDGRACAFGPSAQGTCCNSVCVNTQADPTNCGTCGRTCHSGICAGSFGTGQCVPAGACTTVCGMGFECVGKECVPSACEGPGSSCYAGNGQAGACCFAGFETVCADIGSDPQNCGGCGNVCPSGQTCAAGLCSGTVAPCGAGTVGGYCDLAADTAHLCCAGTGCVDINSDPQNCGQCGNACPSGLGCSNGYCAAATCTAATEGEACVAPGPFSYTNICCGGACVDTSANAANCGGCGSACAGSETCAQSTCGVSACSASTLGDPCHLPSGAGLCCAAGCVDTTSDPSNCGGCGLPCGTGHTCVNSACH